MATQRPSRISTSKITADLRLAGKKGDRSALTIAVESMRMLAHSPKYWEKYLGLLRNPFARMVDMLVIKQGERIANQKGWKLPSPPKEPVKAKAKPAKTKKRGKGVPADASQASLFD
jgi:hypothetical protein